MKTLGKPSSFDFSKMQALGNDFVVINNLSQHINFAKFPIERLAHRQLGIGFDQLLVIEPSEKADFLCRIFNADGNEVEQCGNGLRCVVKYIHDAALLKKSSMRIETLGGIVNANLSEPQQIQISLGVPNFTPAEIPLTMPQEKIYHFEINSEKLHASILSLGNPHFITRVTSLRNYPIEEMGRIITNLSVFPNQTNVGFMEILTPSHIRLRTYERGVGLTQACGSNACAAVVAGIMNHHLENKVRVELPLGDLQVEWANEKSDVLLKGPAEKVFDGTLSYDSSFTTY